MNTKLFGQMLLEKGYVTREQLLDGLAEQRSFTKTLGDLAVAVGMLAIHHIDAIHIRQHAKSESFSQAAVALGFLTEKQIAELLHPNSAERLLLGKILVARGYLDEPALEEALRLHSGDKKQDEPDLLKPFRHSDPGGVGALCVSVMRSVFKETVGTPVSCQPIPAVKAVSADQKVWSQAIAKPGDRFFLAIQADRAAACSIASSVLGMPVAEYDELVQDSVGEFLNLVTGHVCGNLEDTAAGLSASPPYFQEPCDFLRVAAPGIALFCTGDEAEFTFIVARPGQEAEGSLGAGRSSAARGEKGCPGTDAEGDGVDAVAAVLPFELQISLT